MDVNGQEPITISIAVYYAVTAAVVVTSAVVIYKVAKGASLSIANAINSYNFASHDNQWFKQKSKEQKAANVALGAALASMFKDMVNDLNNSGKGGGDPNNKNPWGKGPLAITLGFGTLELLQDLQPYFETMKKAANLEKTKEDNKLKALENKKDKMSKEKYQTEHQKISERITTLMENIQGIEEAQQFSKDQIEAEKRSRNIDQQESTKVDILVK